MDGTKLHDKLQAKIEHLSHQLDEANETIEAIRAGQIDALIVKNENGSQIYTLKTADQTYRVFIERMTEGAVTLNSDGIVLYSNSSLAQMLGFSLSRIIGSDFKDYVEPQSIEEYRSLIQKGWNSEYKGEINLRSAAGKTIPVLLSIATLELDEATALSMIITDLSDHKAKEKELREKNKLLEEARATAERLNNELELRVRSRTNELLISREHFKFLADNIPVIVWKASADGTWEYFSQQWFRYTGLNEQQSQQGGWEPVIHPDDLEETVREWEKCLALSRPFKKENRLRSADGNYRWFLVHAVPFKDDNGKVLAWFGVNTDIEDQKKDMKKKDEFISMASHELKTPVTTLKVFTELMLMDAYEHDQKDRIGMLAKMDKQINKLTVLIGDLLDVSKLNSGKLKYNIESFDFNTLVGEMVDEIKMASPAYTFEVHLGDSTQITGDKNRIGQVIANLLSNAVKYSPHSPKIVIFSEKTEKNIVLSVRDSGIGIAVSDQPKLFTRFFRVSENTFPGLGLGLYICKEIIERHDGTIFFESKEGKGSTFSFSLPC